MPKPALKAANPKQMACPMRGLRFLDSPRESKPSLPKINLHQPLKRFPRTSQNLIWALRLVNIAPMNQPIRTLITAPLILAGRNKTYNVGPDPGMKEQWASFMGDFGKIEGQVGFAAYGVCHSFGGGRAGSSEPALMDYLVGVEVKDAGQVPGYLYTLTIPKRKTAVFLHEGDIAGLPQTWGKIFDEWLPAAKLEVAQGPQFEVYGEDFNNGDDRIEIFIPVK